MAESRPSVKTINALKARQNLGKVLEEVFYQDAQYIIERAGRPMAAVIPLSDLEKLQKHLGATKPGDDTTKERKRRSNKG